MFRRMLRTTRYMYWTTSVTPRRQHGFGLGSGLALAVPAGVTSFLTYLRTCLPTCGGTYLPTYGLPTYGLTYLLPTYLRTYVLTVQAHQCARLLARLKLTESNLCVVVNPKQNASGTGGLKGTQVR